VGDGGARDAGEDRVDDAGAPTLSGLIAGFMVRESLTLQEMAQRCGVSLATVAALRSGSRGKRPHPGTLAKLAAAMDVEVSVLTDAVNRALVPDRAREAALLAGYRALSDPDRREVDALVRRLRAEAATITVPDPSVTVGG
jgi:transcriptional regulator with XRE-family HTH domain